MWRIYERNKPKKMTEKETTIYLLKFALEVIEGEGLERSTNRDNWVIGRDIEEHLEAIQKENKSDIIDLVMPSLKDARLAKEDFQNKKLHTGWDSGFVGLGQHFEAGVNWALNKITQLNNPD